MEEDLGKLLHTSTWSYSWIYVEVDKFREQILEDPEKSLPQLLVTLNDLFSKLEVSIGHFSAAHQIDSSIDGGYSSPLMFEKLPKVNQEGSQWTDCEIRDAIKLVYLNLDKLDSYSSLLETCVANSCFELLCCSYDGHVDIDGGKLIVDS